MPGDLPAPISLPKRPTSPENAGTITAQLDQRMVKGVEWDQLATDESSAIQGDGQTLMWARIPEMIAAVDAVTLAILGEFVPTGVGQSLGRRGGGNSLDKIARLRSE